MMIDFLDIENVKLLYMDTGMISFKVTVVLILIQTVFFSL